MRQDLHKERGADVLILFSTDQQNKYLTAHICSAHVTSLKSLGALHDLPDKIQTAWHQSSYLTSACYATTSEASSRPATVHSHYESSYCPPKAMPLHVCLCSSCFICVEHPSPLLGTLSNPPHAKGPVHLLAVL